MLTFLIVLSGTAHAVAQSSLPRHITGREDSIRQKVFAMGLPVVEVNTVNREFPHYYSVNAPEGCWGMSITGATKVPGRVTISLGDSLLFDSGEYEEDISGMTIKIRGNTSARQPKKPYKIKLQKKADMLRRGDSRYNDKNWLLLTTLGVLADVGFRVNSLLGQPWTPAYEHVNLFFNGEWKGVYLLTESVRRNPSCRINVDTDGFLFEYDPYWWNEDVYVESPTLERPMHYTFKYPEPDEITPEQIAYFTEMITAVEQSLYNGTYANYIDVHSFAVWLLSHDLLGTRDSAGSNYYLTKYDSTPASKVMMANLWDFDTALLCDERWSTLHGVFYFKNLFDSENQAFLREYVELYDAVAPIFYDEIDGWLEQLSASALAAQMEEAVKWDGIRWNEVRTPFSEEIENARQWFARRKVWMDAAIDELRLQILPTTIKRPSDDEALKTYYNLHGQRISMPKRGINLKNGKKYVVR